VSDYSLNLARKKKEEGRGGEKEIGEGRGNSKKLTGGGEYTVGVNWGKRGSAFRAAGTFPY